MKSYKIQIKGPGEHVLYRSTKWCLLL